MYSRKLKEGESIGLIDQNDLRLVERSGRRAVATTDPKTGCVYLSNELRGKFLTIFIEWFYQSIGSRQRNGYAISLQTTVSLYLELHTPF